MQIARQSMLSAYHYIKDVILVENGYIFNETDETLTQDISNPNKYNSLYKNWVYADPTTYPVIISDGGVPVSSSSYRINYPDGSIVFLSYTPTGVVTASYSRDVYNMGRGWSTEEFDRTDLPMIILDAGISTRTPLEIGGGELKNFNYDIDVYEFSDPEAQDVLDVIESKMTHWLPVYDYSTGSPLNYDGSVNTSYNPITQLRGHAEVDVSSAFPVRLSDSVEKERYRWTMGIEVSNIMRPRG